MLAIEFEGGGNEDEQSVPSEDSEENISVSTPNRDGVRSKRLRAGVKDKFGDLSRISGEGIHQFSSSEDDDSIDVKKPRLGSAEDLGADEQVLGLHDHRGDGHHDEEEQGVPPGDPGPAGGMVVDEQRGVWNNGENEQGVPPCDPDPAVDSGELPSGESK